MVPIDAKQVEAGGKGLLIVTARRAEAAWLDTPDPAEPFLEGWTVLAGLVALTSVLMLPTLRSRRRLTR